MKNLKSKIFGISVVINIILGIWLVTMIPEMLSELYEEYVDDSRPDYTGYLDRENYGIMAGEVGRSNRVGAQVTEDNKDYRRFGEYADLLFMKAVFEKAGNTDTAKAFEARISEIRREIPEQSDVLDKIDQSEKNALRE